MTIIAEDQKKVRAKFYVFAQDMRIIDEVFSMASAGTAIKGGRMKLTKTQWVREALHKTVQTELLPKLNRIKAAGKGVQEIPLTHSAPEEHS